MISYLDQNSRGSQHNYKTAWRHPRRVAMGLWQRSIYQTKSDVITTETTWRDVMDARRFLSHLWVGGGNFQDWASKNCAIFCVHRLNNELQPVTIKHLIDTKILLKNTNTFSSKMNQIADGFVKAMPAMTSRGFRFTFIARLGMHRTFR